MIAALRALLDGDLENAIVASTPGGIEAQERTGQLTFVASESLPIDGPRDLLEAMGIEFGEQIDDLFIEARLPDGWQKVATSHSMHSDLVDDKGRRRASIFYKAAFYDRSAHIDVCRRYSFWDSPDYDYDTTPVYGAVTDQGRVIWHTEETVTRPQQASRDELKAYYAMVDNLKAEAKAWLAENYPDWENPLAYWE